MRTLTTIMAPFLPFAAEKCIGMLHLDSDGLAWARATDELPAGHGLAPAEILFKKLDPAEVLGDEEPN
jgi:methionyl-tRNA synthetase